MRRTRVVAVGLLAAVALAGCSEEEPLDAGMGGEGSALRVYSLGGSTQVQGGVDPGEPVVVDLPYVCVVDDPVALVGVELRDPEEGLRVNDVLVTVDEESPGFVRPGRRLADSRLVEEASAGNVVSHGCRGFHSHRVFAELVLDRRALATAAAFRYVYEQPPGDEVRRTDWIDNGYGLDTRRLRRGE